MAVPVVASSTSTAEQFGDLTPALPSGTVSGDLLIAVVCFVGSDAVTPAGWTLQPSSGSYSTLSRVAGSGESAPTFTSDSPTYGVAFLYRITGFNSSSPVNDAAGSLLTQTAPSVTTTVDDCLIIHAYFSDSGGSSPVTVPSGETLLHAPSNIYATAGTSSTSQATAGSTATATFTDPGTPTVYMAATIAIAPASSAPLVTTLDAVGIEVTLYQPLPGPLTTILDVVAAEFSPLQISGNPVITQLDVIAAEATLNDLHPPPFVTVLASVGFEAAINSIVPGPLITSPLSISCEFRPFSPYMQALSEVYRVYIASEALTGNVGTSTQKILDERTTSPYTGTLKDESGNTVLKSTLDACQLVVYDKKTKTVIRETRDAIDMIATNGTVSWLITPFETSLVTGSIPVGQFEPHVATFEFAWDSQDYGDHSLTFASTSGSQIVTVTHAIHGLAAEDYVIYKGAPAVGGLEMDGVFVVVSVTDANTYTVKHVSEATSTASGSGTTTVYRRPMATKHTFEFQVRKREIQ